MDDSEPTTREGVALGAWCEADRWCAIPAPGGQGLSHCRTALDLIDEYRLRIYPVLVGGTPFFARGGQRANLELVDSRTFDSNVVHLRYRVIRDGGAVEGTPHE